MANFLTSSITGLFAAITPARNLSPYENPPGKTTASILSGNPSHAKNIVYSNEKHQLKRETCHGHNYCQEKRLPRLSQFWL